MLDDDFFISHDNEMNVVVRSGIYAHGSTIPTVVVKGGDPVSRTRCNAS
jgi:hypothetical protein